MNKLSLRLLCQIYLLLVLLAATVLSALPYSLLALVWLLMMLFITLRPLPPRLSVVVTAATIFLLPLVLESPLNYLTYATGLSLIIVQTMAVTFILPVIYLLDYYLRQNAQNIKAFIREKPKGRYITPISKTLFVTALALVLVSLTVNNPALLFTSIIFALYLLAILIRVFLTTFRLSVNVPTIWKRVIAGATAEVSLHITSNASLRLHSLLSPADQWVKVTSERFTLSKDRTELNLIITPPLAGPSYPQLRISAIDPWGFIQLNQLVEPVGLHVIPRAKYAEWLAMRYLEQTSIGATAATTMSPKAKLMPKRGVEYFDSRAYQPGDQLRDIDWKHTLKLNQLISKEYIEAGEPAAIIAVNLSVSDAEAADKLIFNLITTALTLAQETVPTALAVYDHQRVILTTTVIHPREILKQTLSVIKDISLVEFTQRFLQLADISRLKRDISQLKQATSEPAQRLLNMLNFEYQAIEKAAKNQPATLALSSATEHAPARAIIVVISQMNHDAEALLVTTEKLARREFTIIPIETK
ncbi:MAG: DUF58 domain-containing protein [Dehalococcoidales bacterium]